MNVINWFVRIAHAFVNSLHGKDRKVWHFKFTWLSNELVPVVDSFTKLEIMCCSNHEKRIQRIKKDENSSSGGI